MNNLLKLPTIYAFLTTIFGGLPFFLYFLERKVGSLPTSEVWYATGINHGPWRMRPEAFTIYYPVVILLIVTLIIFTTRGIKEKKPSLIGFGIILAIIQIGILFLQMYLLTWTID